MGESPLFKINFLEKIMQIGKLNIAKWTWNNMKLANPFLIIWKLIWIIPVYLALALFAIIVGLYELDYASFENIIKENT